MVVIPAGMEGPRADEGPELTERERALPENVVVLCATCQTVVGKATDEYQADVLRGWKQPSQQARAVAHGTPAFTSRSEAREFVERLLGASRAVFDLYGPLDEVFHDTRAEQWRRHVNDTIVPNNRTLLRVLHVNRGLLMGPEKATAHILAVHVQELEERHLEGNWTPGSTKFSNAMESILEGKDEHLGLGDGAASQRLPSG